MTDDQLTRARATLARLAEAERAATPGPWRQWEPDDGLWCGAILGFDEVGPTEVLSSEGDLDDRDAAVIVALRNAAPALLALAEAVADMVACGTAGGTAWSESVDDGGTFCHICEAVTGAGEDHATGCPAVAVDAALAALADEPGVQP